MAERRYVMISFEAPDPGVIKESIARNEIVNKIEEVGGLGWNLLWSHPMVVWREFEDDQSFKEALDELRERVGGVENAQDLK